MARSSRRSHARAESGIQIEMVIESTLEVLTQAGDVVIVDATGGPRYGSPCGDKKLGSFGCGTINRLQKNKPPSLTVDRRQCTVQG